MWVIVIFTVQESADLYSKPIYTSNITYIKKVWMALSRLTQTDIDTAYRRPSILSLFSSFWEKAHISVEDKF